MANAWQSELNFHFDTCEGGPKYIKSKHCGSLQSVANPYAHLDFCGNIVWLAIIGQFIY